MADPERFDAYPDPTFQGDADPDPKFVYLGREKFSNLHLFLLHNLKKRVMCNFLSNNEGGGRKGEEEEMRCGGEAVLWSRTF